MFENILKTIKPTKEEQIQVSDKVKEFLNLINHNLKNAKAIVAGSFAKGTWLSGNHDIDVFVLFGDNNNMSDYLEKAIKNSFKNYERIHGSRDYFIVNFKNLSFELVPVLNIHKPEDAQNITDVSPMHVGWVNKHSTQKIKDDIRLIKHLMKVNNCYGAETYVGGF